MPNDIHHNPYKIGKPVDGPSFYGRGSLLQTLLQQDGELLWLIGNRKIGKTSVLRQLQREALATGRYIPIFLELTPASCLDDWTNCLQEAVEGDWGSAALQSAGIYLVNYGQLDFFTLQRTLMIQAQRAGRKLLILCDEAETLIETAKTVPQLIQRLRREWTVSPNLLNVVIVATKRLWQLAEYDAPLTSPLLSQFAQHYIAQISDEEADALIEQSQNPNGSVSVPKALRDQIRSYTGNHPYLIQNLCHKLYDDNQNSLHNIRPVDLLLEPQLEYGFEIDYESLTPNERLVLLELDRPTTGDVLQQHLNLPISLVANILNTLEKLGFIKSYRMGYGPRSYYLQQWLTAKKKTLRPGQIPVAKLPTDEIEHLQRLLAELRANLRLVEEQEAKFVLDVDIPLQLEKGKRNLLRKIAETVTRLEGAGVAADVNAIPAAHLSDTAVRALQTEINQRLQKDSQ